MHLFFEIIRHEKIPLDEFASFLKEWIFIAFKM